MATIQLAGIRKEYPGGSMAVDGIDLEVRDGELVVLLGPTGCGKTTVLRIVAGLEEATEGHVLFDGRIMDYVPAQERHVAMVFQDYALYPHLTVADNIAFPLRTEISDESVIAARVADTARLVGVEEQLRRRPEQLSGGQRQRVAMARAIVRRPAAFLLDEPLSNVDAAVRAGLRSEIVSLAHRLGVSALYVTHDQTEAMTMADRIAVMRQGRFEQIGPPAEVYGDPDRLFVAAFVGTPRTSLLQAALYARGTAAVVDFGDQVLRIPFDDPRAKSLARHHTERVTVGIRPDALSLVGDDTEDALHGTVCHLEHLGNEVLALIDIGGVPTAATQSQLELPDAPGALAEAIAHEPAHHSGTEALRQTLSRLMPHAHPAAQPATARTRYGFYPVYDPQTPAAPQAGGTLALRIPQPGPVPRLGTRLAVRVNLDMMFLFDHGGDRIRLATGEPAQPRY
ncbi:MAG: multiple sugar transport system ATP-binding protein [Micromonosporaceae bacterium]|jgi:multiple sugar transport system ATP-binding protein